MAVKHYNPKEVMVIFGEIIVEGIAEGTFVEVEPNEDAVSLYVGGDGKGTRAMNNNRSGTIKFTLSQSSKSNEKLSVLHELDRASGAGVRPVMVRDINGTSLYTAATAWVKKGPNGTFSTKIETRQWTLETDSLIPFHGSAGDPPSA